MCGMVSCCQHFPSSKLKPNQVGQALTTTRKSTNTGFLGLIANALKRLEYIGVLVEMISTVCSAKTPNPNPNLPPCNPRSSVERHVSNAA